MTTAQQPSTLSVGNKETLSKRGQSGIGRYLVRDLPIVPSMILFCVFLLGPIVYSFYGAFTDARLSGSKAVNPEFVGLANYSSLFSDSTFYKSILITIAFVALSAVVGQNGVGLSLALMLRESPRVIKGVVQGIVIMAWMLPEIVAAFACYAFFSDQGTLNNMIAVFGMEPRAWLFEFPVTAIIIANIWRGTAFSMLIYSAALTEIPEEVLEAATMDGANGRQKLFRITVPMLKNSIFTNTLLVTLQTLGVFTLIWVMTAGGPGNNSTTLPILAYQEAFKAGMVGMGTAVSSVLLVLGAILSIIYIKVLKPGD